MPLLFMKNAVWSSQFEIIHLSRAIYSDYLVPKTIYRELSIYRAQYRLMVICKARLAASSGESARYRSQSQHSFSDDFRYFCFYGAFTRHYWYLEEDDFCRFISHRYRGHQLAYAFADAARCLCVSRLAAVSMRHREMAAYGRRASLLGRARCWWAASRSSPTLRGAPFLLVCSSRWRFEARISRHRRTTMKYFPSHIWCFFIYFYDDRNS